MSLTTTALVLWIFCSASPPSALGLPNIVFILTDDVDVPLTGLKALNRTRTLLSEGGATFSNAFATTPICCPSRASILTGLYLHNTAVTNNSLSGNCASRRWRDGHEQRTFATFLKRQGYATFYAGKYLNQYGAAGAGGLGHVPPGWDLWAGLKGNSRYYNYALSINGKEERHGEEYESDYLTDVIGRKAHAFLERARNASTPFLMVLSTPSAHAPFIPAPQYRGEFEGERAPRTPAFNYVDAPGRDKHWFIRTQPRTFNSTAEREIDRVYRERLRTLLSVDDLVDGVLRRVPNLDETFFIFTSDHGYHMGQFGLTIDKRQPYEFDIRIPLMIRGPGIAPGTKTDAVALTIDLAPTILDMAGVPRPEYMDGKSLLPFIRASNEIVSSRSDFLVEYHGQGNRGSNDPRCASVVDMDRMDECQWDSFSCKCQDSKNNTYACLRTLAMNEDKMYCVFQDDMDFVEMYDIKRDPYQLTNLAINANQEEHSQKQGQVSRLRECRGWRQCLRSRDAK